MDLETEKMDPGAKRMGPWAKEWTLKRKEWILGRKMSKQKKPEDYSTAFLLKTIPAPKRSVLPSAILKSPI